MARAWGRVVDGKAYISQWAPDDGSITVKLTDLERIAVRLLLDPAAVLHAVKNAGGEHLEPL